MRCVCQARLQLGQRDVGVIFGLPSRFFDRSDVFSLGNGEYVELVVEDEAVGARTEGEDEALVEAGNNGVVC